jgi:chromosomal replication initiation ATPase DnaA
MASGGVPPTRNGKKKMAKTTQTSNATVAKTVTRARSEKLIASLDRVTDRAALEEFVKGSNKRLSLRAATKLAEPSTRAATTAGRKAGAA